MAGKTIRTIADLQLDSGNANKGTERGRAMVGASLRETGAGRSIVVDREGRIISGNKTLEAWAEIAGDTEIEIVRSDGRRLVVVQREDLDLEDVRGLARRMAYLDNRSSETGLEWSPEQLLADINAGMDLEGLWSGDELDELLNVIPDVDFQEFDESIAESVQMCTCPKCGHEFPK